MCGLAPDDSVFMASEEERAEYILNDTGYMYMGFAKQIKEKPWTFGQVIQTVFLWLHQAHLIDHFFLSGYQAKAVEESGFTSAETLASQV